MAMSPADRDHSTETRLMSAAKVFIDGQHGTTGIRIASMLGGRDDVQLLEIDDARRKDPAARAECLRAADLALLCLPDKAAAEAVEMLDGADTRVIDTSSERRTHRDWVYGLPELGHGQRQAIADSARVANPGCYPQSFILALRPLIDAGVLDADCAFTVNAVSGYSGGGRSMIEAHQRATAHGGGHSEGEGDSSVPLYLYGLQGHHKHLPEMQHFSGASAAPLFVPSVEHRYCGMLVSVPLPAPWLRTRGKLLEREDVVSIWRERYGGEPLTRVLSVGESDAQMRDGRFLPLPDESIGNRLELSVYGEGQNGLVLVGRLDNLGKGAAGNAVQCMNLMLGFEESQGLLEINSVAA